eukprot:306833-Chlamydomonas_euryale.AAC.3
MSRCVPAGASGAVSSVLGSSDDSAPEWPLPVPPPPCRDISTQPAKQDAFGAAVLAMRVSAWLLAWAVHGHSHPMNDYAPGRRHHTFDSCGSVERRPVCLLYICRTTSARRALRRKPRAGIGASLRLLVARQLPSHLRGVEYQRGSTNCPRQHAPPRGHHKGYSLTRPSQQNVLGVWCS